MLKELYSDMQNSNISILLGRSGENENVTGAVARKILEAAL